MNKLNLASHGDNREGYINIDCDHPDADIRADVTDLHMFEEGSVSEILAYHILEHFRAGDYETHLSNPLNPKTALEALVEWRRVLTDGGKLEIKVPDFEKIVWLFYNFPKWSRQKGTNSPFPHYTDWLVSNGQHQCLFDKITMKRLLKLAGFRDIQFIDEEPKAVIDRANLEMCVVCYK